MMLFESSGKVRAMIVRFNENLYLAYWVSLLINLYSITMRIFVMLQRFCNLYDGWYIQANVPASNFV